MIIPRSNKNWAIFYLFFKCWPSLKKDIFLTPSMVYIKVINTHITIFHMLDLCGQLSCTASTPVFLTCVYSSCFYFCFQCVLEFHMVHFSLSPSCPAVYGKYVVSLPLSSLTICVLTVAIYLTFFEEIKVLGWDSPS